MKRRIIFPALALILGSGVVFGGSKALAFEQGSVRDTLVQKIAEKFGKSPDEVQAVFDEVRSEHQNEMQSQFVERLTQAVADGKLTEAQKQLISAKHEELVAAHDADALRQVSPEERRNQRQAERDDLAAWAQENGIDLSFFQGPMMFGGGARGGNGMHREEGRRW